jgi:hypothetical protein
MPDRRRSSDGDAVVPSPGHGRCPPGSLAWQQYHVRLISGRTATVGMSLADPRDRTMARVKAQHGAAHLGLLVILDDPDSFEETVLWLHQSTTLTLISQNGDAMIGDEVRAVLPRYFAAFFDEVKELAPTLAEVRLAMPKTGDKTLN